MRERNAGLRFDWSFRMARVNEQLAEGLQIKLYRLLSCVPFEVSCERTI